MVGTGGFLIRISGLPPPQFFSLFLPSLFLFSPVATLGGGIPVGLKNKGSRLKIGHFVRPPVLFFSGRLERFLRQGGAFDESRRNLLGKEELSEGKEKDTLRTGLFRPDLQKHRTTVLSFTDSQGHVFMGGEHQQGSLTGSQTFFQGVGVCPFPHGNIDKFGQGLSWVIEIELPVPLDDPNPVSNGFEQGSVLAEKYFVDVGRPHVSPARLFMEGPEQFFKGDKALGIRHQSELVGLASEDIVEKPAKVFDLYLVFFRQIKKGGNMPCSGEGHLGFLGFREIPFARFQWRERAQPCTDVSLISESKGKCSS